jgi:hypothetical protein
MYNNGTMHYAVIKQTDLLLNICRKRDRQETDRAIVDSGEKQLSMLRTIKQKP